MRVADIDLPEAEIAAFCRKYRIIELSLFGSILRDDYDSESDVDMLVRFAPDDVHSLLDEIAMANELSALLGRKIDLVDREALEDSPNYIKRKAILGNTQIVFREG